MTRSVVAVVGLVLCGGVTTAQYPTQVCYPQTYKPYTPPALYQQYCPPPAKEEKKEDVYDLLLKEAKLRKAISELPPDQRDAMLKRLGWYKEPEKALPGSVPPLTPDEVDRLKGKLTPKN